MLHAAASTWTGRPSGWPAPRCRAGWSGSTSVPDAPVVYVDFAHTPQAVAAALRAVSGQRRRVVVLGCGGDRDPAKRRPMGAAAARGADVVVVTDDNPRSEDPAAIRAAGARGAPPARAAGGSDSRSSTAATADAPSGGAAAGRARRRGRHPRQGPRAGPGDRTGRSCRSATSTWSVEEWPGSLTARSHRSAITSTHEVRRRSRQQVGTPVARAAGVVGGDSRRRAGRVHRRGDRRLAAGPAGVLFVALPGEHVDGHDFVGRRSRGAVAALTAAPVPRRALRRRRRPAGRPGPARPPCRRPARSPVCAWSASPARRARRRPRICWPSPRAAGPTVAPVGNLNNELGLPLTVARLEPDTRFLVAEMGARGIGHIAYLCTIAPAAGRGGAERRPRPRRRVRRPGRDRPRPSRSSSRRCRPTAWRCSTPTTRWSGPCGP